MVNVNLVSKDIPSTKLLNFVSQYVILVNNITKLLIIVNPNATLINTITLNQIIVLIALKELVFISRIILVLNYVQEIKLSKKSIIHAFVLMATISKKILALLLYALRKNLISIWPKIFVKHVQKKTLFLLMESVNNVQIQPLTIQQKQKSAYFVQEIPIGMKQFRNARSVLLNHYAHHINLFTIQMFLVVRHALEIPLISKNRTNVNPTAQ